MADFEDGIAASRAAVAALDLKDVVDESSAANVDAFTVSHVALDWEVDFERREFVGHALLTVSRVAKDEAVLVLDAHPSMTVDRVTIDGEDTVCAFTQGKFCAFGDELRVVVGAAFDRGVVDVAYTTSGEPAATWLDADQAGGKPFVYTMGQACLNRSLFPCQDAPSRRITWSARIRVAQPGFSVVAAAEAASGAAATKAGGVATFAMEKSVPCYLVAVAVGDLERREIGPRSSVYAHPALVDAAAAEFAGVTEKYVAAGEALFGPYVWGRYDILVMPRAFAYGGMENPTLTYLSPTLVVGDGSLTDTVAHEIAHSWFGNLVTNATWAEFFLNEGFTMYAQRRITRAVDGAAITDLETLVGWRLLENEVLVAQGGGDEFSRLRVPISHGVDPDDTYNDVPYEKGFALLCHLCECVIETSYADIYQTEDARRAALDPWLRAYLEEHKFTCASTVDALAHFKRFHPRAFDIVAWPDWLDAEGMCPESYVPPTPAAGPLRIAADVFAARVGDGDAEAVEAIGDAWPAWPTYQRSYFLDALVGSDAPAEPAVLYALGRACGLSETRNAELTMRWALLVLKEALELRDSDVDRHFDLTAKQKFVLPVFRALHAVDAARARETLAKIRKGLDTGVRKKLDKMAKEAPPDITAPGYGWTACCEGRGCPKC